jgi:hypothetical protein
MASHAAQSTTHPSSIIAVLADLKAAPDLGASMAAYLAAPSTPAPVRRFLAVILDQADRLANSMVVTA